MAHQGTTLNFYSRSNLIFHRLSSLPELGSSCLWLLFRTSDQSESSALRVADTFSGDGFWFTTTPVQAGSERPLRDYSTPGGLVAVDQRDKQKQRAESDGTRQYRLHQQNCPAAQEEDVDEQPAGRKWQTQPETVNLDNILSLFIVPPDGLTRQQQPDFFIYFFIFEAWRIERCLTHSIRKAL